MGLPHQSELAWKIVITVFHSIAICATVIRLHERYRKQKMWCDDYVVVLAASLDFTVFVLFWTQYHGVDSITWAQSNAEDAGRFEYSYWFTSFLAYTVLWSSRISLSLSLARIFGPSHRYRKLSLVLTGVCFSFYLASLLASTFICRGSPWWKQELEKCINVDGRSFKAYIAVLFVLDFLADIALVVSPVYMLWKFAFPTGQRRLILVLFSSSALTLVSSVLYCGLYYVGARQGPDSRLVYLGMGHFQLALSLIACNILVVVTLIYTKLRILRERRGPHMTYSNHYDSEKSTTEIMSRHVNGHPLTNCSSTVGTLTSISPTDESVFSREFISTSVAFDVGGSTTPRPSSSKAPEKDTSQ
ncbi:hypothetical protein CPC08DRAFT_662395 [Agrocybe pediades]|nr:hypothetical protein CPC08DRAFT_662395 [Agrocybe pediades]